MKVLKAVWFYIFSRTYAMAYSIHNDWNWPLIWLGIFFLSLGIGIGIFALYRFLKKKRYHDITRKQKETHVHMQIGMLGCALVMFCSMCCFFACHGNADWIKWFAGIGVLLTWICQDVIKNVVAYFSLKLNGMIQIEDWVILEKYGIDGQVDDISLTSVIVKNWDETYSSISTKTFLDTSMQNLQNVVDKKNAGRRMQRNFLLDVHSIRDLSLEALTELKEIIQERDGDDSAITYAITHGERQNLRIFRRYLRHWLLNQDTVTRSPKFAIRLFDQTPEGLPMQVYAFLLPTQWEEFEQEQARIVEHIVGAIDLFGLVLFQHPAGTDTNNVHLTKGE